MKLIGVCGPLGSGKSTIAEELQRYGFVRLRFADALKQMMMALGCSKEEVDGSLKETPCALLCGRTPRYAMQTIGTEWGRDMIGKDIWVAALQHRINALKLKDPNVQIVVDDVRFANEFAMIRANGGALWRVQGRRKGDVAPKDQSSKWPWPLSLIFGEKLHPSEVEWRKAEVDGEINNSGSRGELRLQVNTLMRRTGWTPTF